MLVVEFEAADLAAGRRAGPHGDREGRAHRIARRGAGDVLQAGGLRAVCSAWRRPVEGRLMRFRGPARPVSRLRRCRRASGPARRRARASPAALPGQQNVTWTLDAYAGEGRLRLRPFLDLSRAADRERAGAAGCRRLRHRPARRADDLRFPGLRPGAHAVPPQAVRRADPGLPRDQGRFRPDGAAQPGQGHRRRSAPDDPGPPARAHRAREPIGPGDAPRRSATRRRDPRRGGAASRHRAALRRTRPTASERSRPRSSGVSAIQPALIWPDLEMLEMASACHGCGICRTLEPTLRMCPSFRASRMEAASPRAQANLIRQVATGAVDPRLWGSDELKAHADLCIHCKLCKPECPSGVDVSSLMVEAKAAYVEKHGLPPGDWIFSRLEVWARLGSRFPIVTNFLLTRRWARAAAGAAAGRLETPRAAARPAGRRSRDARRGWGSTSRARSSPARGSSTSSTSSPTTTTRSSPRRSSRCSATPRSTSTSPRSSGARGWPRWSSATSTMRASRPWRISASSPTPSATATRSSARSRRRR